MFVLFLELLDDLSEHTIAGSGMRGILDIRHTLEIKKTS